MRPPDESRNRMVRVMPYSCYRVFQILVAVLLMVAATPAPAHADVDTDKAKQLYAQGVTEYNLGHYDQALGDFENGYRVRQDPAFLFNIAQCQRMLHRYEDAERTYRAYLRESTGLADAQREQIQKLIGEMEHAEEEQRAKAPPAGTQPPATAHPSDAASATRAQQSSPTEGQTTKTVDLTASAPPARERPLYKRGWFWGVMAAAVVVVGAGVGLGVGLGTSAKYPNATMGTVVKQ